MSQNVSVLSVHVIVGLGILFKCNWNRANFNWFCAALSWSEENAFYSCHQTPTNVFGVHCQTVEGPLILMIVPSNWALSGWWSAIRPEGQSSSPEIATDVDTSAPDQFLGNQLIPVMRDFPHVTCSPPKFGVIFLPFWAGTSAFFFLLWSIL